MNYRQQILSLHKLIKDLIKDEEKLREKLNSKCNLESNVKRSDLVEMLFLQLNKIITTRSYLEKQKELLLAEFLKNHIDSDSSDDE